MNGHIELAMALEWETSVLSLFPTTDPVRDSVPSESVGKYELRGLLGKGAMGAVHRAFDPVLEREVAIKVMLPRIADDPEHKRRFEREARAVARMSHPNVVTVFDLGYHTDGSPYIVMELLKGRDLHQTLSAEPALSLERKLAVVLQVLEGLGQAHRAGIVHRDIKPANIFINESGTAKVMDFGVAHFPAASGATRGVVVGTANYMSPEQVLGGRVDGRSDLFSVGCMLGEMLTGRPPFEAATAMSTLYRVAHQEPHLPLPESPQSERLLAILQRSLAKTPEARFASAEELAAAIRGCLEASPNGPTRTSGTPRPAAGPETRPQAPPAEPKRPSRPADPAGICKLLRDVYLGNKSGHLHFSHAKEHRSLRLLQGRIVHGTSDVAGEHLGDVLVRYGHLSQADLERAITVVLGDRKRLGTVLSETGRIGPEALGEAVGEHVREILFSALERPDGKFAFEELPDTLIEADLTCKLTTGEAILEATRRVHDPALIEGALGDLNRVLVTASDPRLQRQEVTLTPTDGFVLSRIDGTLSAREMLSLVPGSQEDAARSLFGLLCTGLVDYKVPSPSRPSPTRPSPSGPDAAPAADRLPTRAVISSPEPAGEELRQMLLSAYEGLRYKDHFELLDVPRAASAAEIREAYARLVRILHPDACRDPSVADLVTERSAVFARLCQAYETLRSPTSRATYERERAPVKLRPSLPRPTPPTPANEAAAASPVPPPPEPLPIAAPTFTDEVEEDTPSASDSLIVATRLVKQEKYWEAIVLLEPAIPRLVGPARHRARVLLAQAYLKNPLWSKRAEAVLQRVVIDDPQHVDAHFLLAGLYLKTQLEARAAAMFRKVLELSPSHAGAAAGLKALQSPKELSFRLPFLKRA
jgi:serine/threonine protein kinase/tetratricopeptide (TPR) repeat protein